MARKSRIDAPGAIHHIIVRGIERKGGKSAFDCYSVIVGVAHDI